MIAIFDCVRDTGRGARLCAPTDVYFTQLKTAMRTRFQAIATPSLLSLSPAQQVKLNGRVIF
ncbi:hypothetical protein [Scytonema millei]|uniref:hypothetical protein n=1 Tax=Scytonema millei TaxID=1245922 RepID=UPI0013F49995|nr:hypothetical protein [Scytonema millei]